MKKRYDLTTIHGILASSEDHELTISPSLYFRLEEQTSDTSDGEFEITRTLSGPSPLAQPDTLPECPYSHDFHCLRFLPTQPAKPEIPLLSPEKRLFSFSAKACTPSQWTFALLGN